MSWAIVQHDCEVDDDGSTIFGPFETEAEAHAFVDRHRLFMPTDGGYAFAVVLGPDARTGGMTDPAEWDERLVDLDEAEVLEFARQRRSEGAPLTTIVSDLAARGFALELVGDDELYRLAVRRIVPTGGRS